MILIMPEITNLTDRISHLRDRKAGSPIISGSPTPKKPQKAPAKRKVSRSTKERRMDTDYFMLFVYALLATSLVCQVGLIVWLDL